MKIYGGFVGTEMSIEDRPESDGYVSILSGDINTPQKKEDNCLHVLTFTHTLTIDHVTLSDGYANYEQYSNQIHTLHKYGGALITSDHRSPTNLILNHVTFANNTALNGGSLFFGSNSRNHVDVVISNCKFINNHAMSGDTEIEGGYGGAIYAYHLPIISITNTEFIDNTAAFRGGAVYQDYGAVLHCAYCTFNGNTAAYGGAVFSEDRNSQTAGTFPSISNSVFTDNYAQLYGGAICWFNGVIGTLNQNQFNGNIAGGMGGAIAMISSTLNTDSSGNSYLLNTDDVYSEPSYAYTDIDMNLSFSIGDELAQLLHNFESNTFTDTFAYSTDHSICYVDASNTNGPPTQDGTSWSTAYSQLQDCLDTIADEVWVKAGLYVPTTVPDWKVKLGKTLPQFRSFTMRENTRMYGGFDGTETIRSQRDFSTNPTYLSCKVLNNMFCSQIVIANDNCIVDGFIFVDSGRPRNAPGTRRRMANSVSVEEILSSRSTTSGAGIYSNSTNIIVINTIFYRLFSAGKGGAVYCIGQQGEDTTNVKSPTFMNVAFLGNRAVIRGGAISGDVQCNFVCDHCKFDSNSVSSKGGAIYLDFDANPIIKNSVFMHNIALESGGCLAEDGQSWTVFVNTSFINNSALFEGACLYSGSGVGPTTDQGFTFQNYTPHFEGNHMIHDGSGHSDIYGWPFTVILYDDITENNADTLNNTITVPIIDFPSNYNVNNPNVVLFVVDDLEFTSSWSHSAPIGTHLNGKTISYLDIEHLTPNIQRLIDEGITFSRAYAAAPLCSPSRFAILTGKNAIRSAFAKQRTSQTSNGFYGTNVTIPVSKLIYNDSIYNLPNTLKTMANYYTGMVGKWHLMTANDNGYNYGCRGLSSESNGQIYENCAQIVKQQGFDFVDGFYHSNIKESDAPYSHNPEWMLHNAQTMIDNAVQNNQPFFLYFASTLTHTPSITDALMDSNGMQFTPKGQLTGDSIPNTTGMAPRAEILQRMMDHAPNGNTKTQNSISGYLWLDECVGAFIEFLEANALYNDTFIVFTSDHGMSAKGVLYEHGSRVMKVVRYPPLFGTKGHILSDKFIVSNVDLAATVYEMIGLDSTYSMDSKSWLDDVINEINGNGADSSCCVWRFMDIYNSHAIVSKAFKYIYRATSEVEEQSRFYPNALDTEQLYDLTQDPSEQINVVDASQTRDDVLEFRLKMISYIQNVACYADECAVPEIISTTTSPSISPTIFGMTCARVVDYSQVWKGVRRWTETTNAERRLQIAEQAFLNKPAFSNCGVFGELEYVYKFIYQRRRLEVDMVICCGPDSSQTAHFGESYVSNDIPAGYQENNAMLGRGARLELLDDNNPGHVDAVKSVVFVSVAIIVVIGVVFVIYRKRKYFKQRLKLFIDTRVIELTATRNNEQGTPVEKEALTKRTRLSDSAFAFPAAQTGIVYGHSTEHA